MGSDSPQAARDSGDDSALWRARPGARADRRGFAWYNLPDAFKRRLPQDLDYPSPPSEALAQRVEALLQGVEPVRRVVKRGLEHTVWMPLLYMFPAADVPVLELSFPYRPDADILALGKRLSALRDEGILILTSGTVTHNLAAATMNPANPIAPWAQEFDAWAKERLVAKDVDALLDWRHRAPAAELAHPDDGGHFRVLLFALGAVLGNGGGASDVRFPVEGYEFGVPKRCVQMGG